MNRFTPFLALALLLVMFLPLLPAGAAPSAQIEPALRQRLAATRPSVATLYSYSSARSLRKTRASIFPNPQRRILSVSQFIGHYRVRL